MPKRNPHIAKLASGYLFPEIAKRKMDYLKHNPQADIISLGIGDTTEPIPQHIVNGLIKTAADLGTPHGYTGYSHEQGQENLRKKIVDVYYQNQMQSDEIFISDGTKCDIGRLQMLFGSDCKMAVQDPSYPAYVDTGVALGQTGNHTGAYYDGIIYMPCLPENDFFPDLTRLPKMDIIYFCSPNNPTGAAASREQLERLVNFAVKENVLIIFDAAYAAYIRDESLPRSIYEIPHAKKVAIELNSFSKMAGFTGVRLGWSVVPKELKYISGESIHKDWNRIASTFFNGASNIAQGGALAALDPQGLIEMRAQTDFYLENAELIKEVFLEAGFPVYGATNAPYIWVQFPGKSSWDVFNELLNSTQIVCTPGSGFGPAGEGFVRFSAFGNRARILTAIDRLKTHFSSKILTSCQLSSSH